MSRRRINSGRRQSRLRSSSSCPGELEEDSDVFEADDPFWYKRMEGNNTVLRPSLQLNNAQESSTVLDSGSDVDMPPPLDGWWNPLGKFNLTVNRTSEVRRTIRSSVNSLPAIENTTLHEDSLDSLPEKDSKKRKKRLILGLQKRESLGGSPFLNILNESATTIISDPGPTKMRKSVPKTSFLSDDDSFKQTKNLRTGKSRPSLFKKIQASQFELTNNIFNNLLENVSSSSESSISSVNNIQQARTLNESQNNGVQNTREIDPSQDARAVVSQKRRSKDIEESNNSDPNLSRNLSKKQRTIRSSSKADKTSIFSDSKAKTSFAEEQIENSTSESKSSDLELKKKRPGLFKRTRKSAETNPFDSIFTSEGESIQEVVKLNKSQNRNSSTKSLEEGREEKQNRVNLSRFKSSRLTPFEESNNHGSKQKESEDLSDSISEIDVEYKKDESTKCIEKESLQSSSRNRKSDKSLQMENVSQSDSQQIFHKIPVASINRSKHTSKLLGSEEEEDLISVTVQGIFDQSDRNSSLSISRKHNSSLNKSRGSSQNFDGSRRSSRLNESIELPDRLSTFTEQPQYESTRKIDAPESRKSLESKRLSRLDSASNKDLLKELISEESTTEQSPTGKSNFLNPSRNVSSKNTFDNEETLNEEVFDPKNNSSARTNSSYRAENRKSRSQYDSVRKIEVSKSRNSQSKRASKLDSASNASELKDLTGNKSDEELPTGKSTSVNQSGNVSSRKRFDNQQASDIEISDPQNDNLARNISFSSSEKIKSINSQSRKVSKLVSVRNEDQSTDLTTNKSIEELSTEQLTSINQTRNVSCRKTFDDEEASDIEVSDPKNNDISMNNSTSSAEKIKSRSQYESLRKIEVSKSRNSQSRIVSKLESASIEYHSKDLAGNKSTDELSTEKSNSVNQSRNVSSIKSFDNEEVSDMEISDPKNDHSARNNSFSISEKIKSSLQYESPRKIEISKSINSQSRKVSKLGIVRNEDKSTDLTKNQSAEELSTEKLTSINQTRNVSSRKTFDDEEASDIEVSDPRNNSAMNNSTSSIEKIKSRSQYESLRKIEASKSRNSQSRIVSKLDSAIHKDHLKDIMGNRSSEELLKNVSSSRKTFGEEESSDIEVSDPKSVISTEDNRNKFDHCKLKSKNNVTKSEESSGEFANKKNRTKENEGIFDSQSSHTISLSESEVPSENGLLLNNTSQNNQQSTKRSSNNRYGTSFIPLYSSSDEQNVEENNLSKEKTAKPIITGYEILKVNDIDIRKLKAVKEVMKGNDESIISGSQSTIRDIPVSDSVKKSSIFTKDSQMLGVEEEFRRLHEGGNSELTSTSRVPSQVSPNRLNKDVDKKAASETLNNKSSSDLRNILEDEDDNESEITENPLLIYSEKLSEKVEKSQYEETSPARYLQRRLPSVFREHFRDRKQKMICDYFKYRDAEKTNGESQLQRIPFAKAAGDKNLMANNKKQLEAIIAPIKKELFKKPKEPEPRKKKLFIPIGTSKKNKSKSVDPAYLVNGVVYKPPPLPSPKRWVTDHLYKFIWKKIEPKYKGKTRVRSEKFILKLTKVFNLVTRKGLYKNYVDDLDSLIVEMARLKLIVNRKDFNDFCNEFMPYDFRVKATPILLPGNNMSIPYDPEKFYERILIDDSSLAD
ncbi:serine-rich adhesin for platelets-like [Belonocnema kinseyi]|uniref:serine-rich adhesin for platelets-like n=1 Tax=Belonocnema kinseyi TaxID=2817044 RepID=UPI00143DB954|nr:serine-rich adhesin for platelets-like [Belonocnema kinseyi]